MRAADPLDALERQDLREVRNEKAPSMKALTVCQPYAELIALGDKPIENRTWPTRFRGYLAIHAGKSRQWMEAGDEVAYPGMAFGAVVCVARVIACLHIDADWPERIAHLKQHEHANGPWCWVFARHVIRCEPIPVKGAQGLWDLPETAADVLRACPARFTPVDQGKATGSAMQFSSSLVPPQGTR